MRDSIQQQGGEVDGALAKVLKLLRCGGGDYEKLGTLGLLKKALGSARRRRTIWLSLYRHRRVSCENRAASKMQLVGHRA